ncbi:hypothetical protein BHM03_00058098, partial [Ensete ventricosum]
HRHLAATTTRRCGRRPQPFLVTPATRRCPSPPLHRPPLVAAATRHCNSPALSHITHYCRCPLATLVAPATIAAALLAIAAIHRYYSRPPMPSPSPFPCCHCPQPMQIFFFSSMSFFSHSIAPTLKLLPSGPRPQLPIVSASSVAS